MSSSSTEFLELSLEDKIKLLSMVSIPEMGKLCSLNKQMQTICYNSPSSERIFHERSLRFIPDFVRFKEEGMKWRDFYIRVTILSDQIDVFSDPPVNRLSNILAGEGKLFELKILAALDPPQMPYADGVIEAAKNGHLEVLKWIYERDKLTTGRRRVFSAVAYFSNNFIRNIIRHGQLEVLKWFYDLPGFNNMFRPTYDDMLTIPTYNGDLEMVKWLASEGYIIPKNKISTSFLAGKGWGSQIANPDYLGLLKYFATRPQHDEFEQHGPVLPDVEAANVAAEAGHTDVLEWMASLNPPVLPTVPIKQPLQ